MKAGVINPYRTRLGTLTPVEVKGPSGRDGKEESDPSRYDTNPPILRPPVHSEELEVSQNAEVCIERERLGRGYKRGRYQIREHALP